MHRMGFGGGLKKHMLSISSFPFGFLPSRLSLSSVFIIFCSSSLFIIFVHQSSSIISSHLFLLIYILLFLLLCSCGVCTVNSSHSCLALTFFVKTNKKHVDRGHQAVRH